VGNLMELNPQGARGAQGAEMVRIVRSAPRAVKMHMGGNPIHTRLCTEPEESEYIGGAGSKARGRVEEQPADGQVEMQVDISRQAAGVGGDFSAEFLKPNFRCSLLSHF